MTLRKEYQVICPDHIEALTTAKRAAVAMFGGYTVIPGNGGWIDDAGKLIEEPVHVLLIAAEPCEATAIRIEAIADLIGRIAKQQCVYWRDSDGNVQLRDTTPLWAPLPAGVQSVPLDDPATLHNAIADAVGE